MNENHVQPTPEQFSHNQVASTDRNQLASVNGGHPSTTAMNRVGGSGYNGQGHFNHPNHNQQGANTRPAQNQAPAPHPQPRNQGGQHNNHPQNAPGREEHHRR
jgi:hypothetical protein